MDELPDGVLVQILSQVSTQDLEHLSRNMSNRLQDRYYRLKERIYLQKIKDAGYTFENLYEKYSSHTYLIKCTDRYGHMSTYIKLAGDYHSAAYDSLDDLTSVGYDMDGSVIEIMHLEPFEKFIYELPAAERITISWDRKFTVQRNQSFDPNDEENERLWYIYENGVRLKPPEA